ncbi:MAG: hypothetical protein ACLP4V_12860 [Methylocella sp.]
MFKIQPTIFILAISLISSSQSLAEEPAYNAKTWNEALSIVPCDHVKKNPNGSWAVSATIVIDKERFVDPTIAEKEQADILQKRCACRPGSLSMMGVGC